MPLAVLGLGSNQAGPKEQLDRAVEALAALGQVKEVAPYIVSKPKGMTRSRTLLIRCCSCPRRTGRRIYCANSKNWKKNWAA